MLIKSLRLLFSDWNIFFTFSHPKILLFQYFLYGNIQNIQNIHIYNVIQINSAFFSHFLPWANLGSNCPLNVYGCGWSRNSLSIIISTFLDKIHCVSIPWDSVIHLFLVILILHYLLRIQLLYLFYRWEWENT